MTKLQLSSHCCHFTDTPPIDIDSEFVCLHTRQPHTDTLSRLTVAAYSPTTIATFFVCLPTARHSRLCRQSIGVRERERGKGVKGRCKYTAPPACVSRRPHLAVVLHGQIQPLGLQLAAARAGVLEQLAAVVEVHLDVRWQLATLRCAAGAGLLRTGNAVWCKFHKRRCTNAAAFSLVQAQYSPAYLLSATQLLAPLLAIQAQATEGHALALNGVRIHAQRHPRLHSCVQ